MEQIKEYYRSTKQLKKELEEVDEKTHEMRINLYDLSKKIENQNDEDFINDLIADYNKTAQLIYDFTRYYVYAKNRVNRIISFYNKRKKNNEEFSENDVNFMQRQLTSVTQLNIKFVNFGRKANKELKELRSFVNEIELDDDDDDETYV